MKNHGFKYAVALGCMGIMLVASPVNARAAQTDTKAVTAAVTSDAKNTDNKKNDNSQVKTVQDLQNDIDILKGKTNVLSDQVQKRNDDCKNSIMTLKNKKGISKKKLRIFNKNERLLSEKTALISGMTDKLKQQNDKLDDANKKLDKLKADYDAEAKQQKFSMSQSDWDKTIYSSMENVLNLTVEKNSILVDISAVLDDVLSLLP